ncbi:MAG: sodium-dependent bicarbonate transport family permease [Rhodospirillaceae bacterium]
MLAIAADNLLSPMTLAFVLGVLAALVRSDLRLPEQIYAVFSLYLLFAIGLKGGAALAVADPWAVLPALGVTLVLGTITPLWSYGILRRVGRFAPVDAAAIAAHYGSVSAVTFIAAGAFLEADGRSAEAFIPALVAVLEVPAILIAILVGRQAMAKADNASADQTLPGAPAGTTSMGALMHELLAGKVTLMLAGGLVIGFLSGPDGLDQVAPLFIDPFKGVLTLFLLELGRLAGQRLSDLPKVGVFLIAFGILMPILNGTVGAGLGLIAGLSPGGAFLLAVLAASASYIAAPAAVRMTLPEANPGYYLTASLAITFPFNIILGLPLYLSITEFLASVLG